jgi:hypothetical protein
MIKLKKKALKKKPELIRVHSINSPPATWDSGLKKYFF